MDALLNGSIEADFTIVAGAVAVFVVALVSYFVGRGRAAARRS